MASSIMGERDTDKTRSYLEWWLRGDHDHDRDNDHVVSRKPLFDDHRLGFGSSDDSSPPPKHSCDDLGLAESLSRMTLGGTERPRRLGPTLGLLGYFSSSPSSYNDINDYNNINNNNNNSVGCSRDFVGSAFPLRSSSGPTLGYHSNKDNNGLNKNPYHYYNCHQNPNGGPCFGGGGGEESPVWSQPNDYCFNRGLGGEGGGLFGNHYQGFNGNVNSPFRDRSAMRMSTRYNPRIGVDLNPVLSEYEGFACEDSLILEGTTATTRTRFGPGVINERRGGRGGGLRLISSLYPEDGFREIDYLEKVVLETFRAMASQEGFLYLMAKDQSGCRNLQKVFEVGSREDVKMIYGSVVDHVVELSTDPFGNYLVQKLLEVCLDEQRRQIVFVMTKEPGDLLRVSLNTHGTRVVQKLIETAETWISISSLMKALKPGILDLIKDLNGNHVLQSCLKCLGSEDNAFIFEAATMFCVEIATHRHGCCVMQKCIECSPEHYKRNLVTEILKHAVFLAADPYGNYVIQFIMDQKIQYAILQLTCRFKGNYVHLSTLKCGSHVVEKCLKELPEAREAIVRELLDVDQFDQLLQDPYANYVIQSALKLTKGKLYDALFQRVRSHNQTLRASPYCKKILSQAMHKR